MCMFCAFCVYVTQCVGFICLRTQYKDLPRLWSSPLGIPGAVISIIIFSTGLQIIGWNVPVFLMDIMDVHRVT